MTGRERDVIRAISTALMADSKKAYDDMDAYATSYPVDDRYWKSTRNVRAGLLLEALYKGGNRG